MNAQSEMLDRSGAVAAIILAAGASTRLGRPKQLALLNGEMLLARAVRIAKEAGCSPVMVVLGAEAEHIRAACPLYGITVVLNERWRDGMASSIHCGLNAASGASGALLMTCDQPAVTPDHLHALANCYEVTASAYAGRHGVPAYFPVASFAALMQLTGDMGARELLRTARTVPLAHGELDIDTPEALAEAQRLLAESDPR